MGSAIYVSGDAMSGFSTASTTSFGGVLGSQSSFQAGGAGESIEQNSFAAGGIISNFFTSVAANARTTDTIIKLRLNGVDTAIALTYSTTQTGVKSDTSNSVTVAQDDLFCGAQANGSGGGGLTVRGSGVRFDATSGTLASAFGSSFGSNFNGTGPLTYYAAQLGLLVSNNTTEAKAQVACPVAGTAKYLQVNVTTNIRTTNCVVTSRINGVSGNQTVTYTSGQTGLKKDTVNTDALTAGNNINFEVDLGASTGGFNIASMGYFISTTNSGESFAANVNSSGVSIAAASTLNIQFAGRTNTSATETDRQLEIGTACTASKLWCNVLTNASTTNMTLRLRNGAANVNQIVTITNGVTGVFQDSTNTDSIAATDLVNYQLTGGTTGAVVLTAISMLFAVSSGAIFIAGRPIFINQAVNRAGTY